MAAPKNPKSRETKGPSAQLMANNPFAPPTQPSEPEVPFQSGFVPKEEESLLGRGQAGRRGGAGSSNPFSRRPAVPDWNPFELAPEAAAMDTAGSDRGSVVSQEQPELGLGNPFTALIAAERRARDAVGVHQHRVEPRPQSFDESNPFCAQAQALAPATPYGLDDGFLPAEPVILGAPVIPRATSAISVSFESVREGHSQLQEAAGRVDRLEITQVPHAQRLVRGLQLPNLVTARLVGPKISAKAIRALLVAAPALEYLELHDVDMSDEVFEGLRSRVGAEGEPTLEELILSGTSASVSGAALVQQGWARARCGDGYAFQRPLEAYCGIDGAVPAELLVAVQTRSTIAQENWSAGLDPALATHVMRVLVADQLASIRSLSRDAAAVGSQRGAPRAILALCQGIARSTDVGLARTLERAAEVATGDDSAIAAAHESTRGRVGGFLRRTRPPEPLTLVVPGTPTHSMSFVGQRLAVEVGGTLTVYENARRPELAELQTFLSGVRTASNGTVAAVRRFVGPLLRGSAASEVTLSASFEGDANDPARAAGSALLAQMVLESLESASEGASGEQAQEALLHAERRARKIRVRGMVEGYCRAAGMIAARGECPEDIRIVMRRHRGLVDRALHDDLDITQRQPFATKIAAADHALDALDASAPLRWDNLLAGRQSRTASDASWDDRDLGLLPPPPTAPVAMPDWERLERTGYPMTLRTSMDRNAAEATLRSEPFKGPDDFPFALVRTSPRTGRQVLSVRVDDAFFHYEIPPAPELEARGLGRSEWIHLALVPHVPQPLYDNVAPASAPPWDLRRLPKHEVRRAVDELALELDRIVWAWCREDSGAEVVYASLRGERGLSVEMDVLTAVGSDLMPDAVRRQFELDETVDCSAYYAD